MKPPNIKIISQGIIEQNEKIYISFPDIERLADGSLLAIYRHADMHHPTWSKLILARSKDGRNWHKKIFAELKLSEDNCVFNCPRINVLPDGRYAIICDLKSSQKEGEADWRILSWWSEDTYNWRKSDMKIEGMMPDKLIPGPGDHRLMLAYHKIERLKKAATDSKVYNGLIQLLAFSTDSGDTWYGRTIIGRSPVRDYCEGCIVRLNDTHLACYLRDNRKTNRACWVNYSADNGRTWPASRKTKLFGHRVIAKKKLVGAMANQVVGTFRNTATLGVGFFVHDLSRNQLTTVDLDHETDDSHLFHYGYTSWAEMDDGSIYMVYYIKKNQPTPYLCFIHFLVV